MHCDSKANIPDTSSASYHEEAAKLLSNCFTIGFCLRTSRLSKAKLTGEKHLGRREQKGGQEVEARDTAEMKGGMKDAVFNRSSWVTAEGMASLAFQSGKQLMCCVHECCCCPMSVRSLVHAGPGTWLERMQSTTGRLISLYITPSHELWLKYV